MSIVQHAVRVICVNEYIGKFVPYTLSNLTNIFNLVECPYLYSLPKRTTCCATYTPYL